MPSNFRSYIDKFGELPEDVTLGYMVYYSVYDGLYDGPKMEADFINLGLNMDFLPGAINPSDAFEKAAKSCDNTRYELNPPSTQKVDHHAVVLVREAKRDSEKIVRKIIREIRDSSNARLQHDEVGEFVFYRPKIKSGKIDYTSVRVRSGLVATNLVSQTEELALKQMLADFAVKYDRYCDYHDGQKIRALERGYLLYLNAIQMKASVYFVHQTRADELKRLAEFIRGLGVEGTTMTLIPLADLPHLRSEVIECYQREAVEELIAVSDAIDKLRSNRLGPATQKAYEKLIDQYAQVMAKANEYTRTLSLSQDVTADTALFVQDKLTALNNEVVQGLTKHYTDETNVDPDDETF